MFHFSHILSTLLGMSLVYRSCWFVWWVVDSGPVIHDLFGCLFTNSDLSTNVVYCASYFIQSVLEIRVMATSQSTHRYLLFDPSLRSSFSPIMGYFPPLVARLMVGFAVAAVSDAFLVVCSSFLSLFFCHLIPHYPAMTWTPGEGYLIPFIIEGSNADLDVTLTMLMISCWPLQGAGEAVYHTGADTLEGSMSRF